MKKAFFISDKKQRIAQIVTGIIFLVMSIFLIFYSFLEKENPRWVLILYLVQGVVLIYSATSHYNEISIFVKNDKLILKWKESFKKKQLKIETIKNIDLNRKFLTVSTTNGDDFKYLIVGFDNQKRKDLLSFFKESFNEKVSVNSK